MIRTTKTGLSKRDQEEFTRNTVEAALESERYIVWMFRVENGVLYKDHSMLHFPDGDYTAMMQYIRETVADIVKPKMPEAKQEDGNGQPEPTE